MTSMRHWIRTAAFALAAIAVAVPASAQIVQTVHFGIGGFYPRGFDSRDAQDTLVADLTDAEPLAFDINQFRSATFFGEWIGEIGPHLSIGGGITYYGDTVHSVYAGLINADGSEINQDLKLRMTPITGIVRFMPFGNQRSFQPYLGVGLAVIPYRYSESGEFVDTSDPDPANRPIFVDRFTTTGTAFGPVVAGGFRAPIGGDIYALTMEYRYQFATGDTGGLPNGFLGDKIDLSGGNLNFGFLIRF